MMYQKQTGMKKGGEHERAGPDAEALERVARLDGGHGAEQQFQSMRARTVELVDQSFDFFSFKPAQGAGVLPGEQPMIYSRE